MCKYFQLRAELTTYTTCAHVLNLAQNPWHTIRGCIRFSYEAGIPLAEGRPEALESGMAYSGHIWLCRAVQGLCGQGSDCLDMVDYPGSSYF